MASVTLEALDIRINNLKEWQQERFEAITAGLAQLEAEWREANGRQRQDHDALIALKERQDVMRRDLTVRDGIVGGLAVILTAIAGILGVRNP